MFRKVLIANRGEIAVRIIRACRDLDVSPVAVYSEADRASLHVRLADEAHLLGPAPSSESYLAIDKVIEAARRSKVDAIHPGYGFLSENPNFAAACSQAGIPMVGPSTESMRKMGSKTGARSLLLRAGVPLVPGTYRALKSVDEAIGEARIIGYPLMLKAAAGGGGKGMRLVTEESRLQGDFEAASSEALRAFGDPSLYFEKYIVRPRHVEIQVLADHHGNAIYLGERECSIQRRHQKVVEECPSPLMDEDLRRRMGESAIRVLQAANYENAGTVEFLMDEDRRFYFLEMNTRLQVEHPVTEAVTGIDIVREQLRIAFGEPLSLRQEDISMRGWALECRIYAEDPDRNFFPSPGTIRRLVEPQGPGVRMDSGVYEGWEVPIHYDPLIAKLIAFGSNRSQAVARMRRAIQEYRIEGIKTNLNFFAELLRDPEFVAGKLSTGFIEEFQKRRVGSGEVSHSLLQANAIAAALAYIDDAVTPESQGSGQQSTAWRTLFRPNIQTGWRSWRR
jgi:acetyl-CoA carboxylase, biotin carboxylase subunit